MPATRDPPHRGHPHRTAPGAGAFGSFTVTADISLYCSAYVFAGIGRSTPVFVRFSTDAGERGAADA
ncbi:catalase, partial [Stenotrophomonas sp. SrG]|uniref:catalase n=1 Tax=Stenotrophomonas sp. SrG TaxID=3414430 RepID=UPI003CFA8590